MGNDDTDLKQIFIDFITSKTHVSDLTGNDIIYGLLESDQARLFGFIEAAFKEIDAREPGRPDLEWSLLDIYELFALMHLKHKQLTFKELKESLAKFTGVLTAEFIDGLTVVGYEKSKPGQELNQLCAQFQPATKALILITEYLTGKASQYLIRDTFMAIVTSGEEKIPILDKMKEDMEGIGKWTKSSQDLVDMIKMSPLKKAVTARITKKPSKQYWVLIIEPDAVTRNIYRKVVEREGHLPLEADNGKQGMTLLESYNPGMVIMEIKLDQVHGLEIILQIKKKRMNIPVIICTSIPSFKNEMEIATLPMKQFYVKPVDTTHLAQSIRDMIAQKIQQSQK